MTGALERSEQQVVVEAGICRRELGADLRPVRIEFLGDDGRQASRDALPFVQVLDDDSHRVVAADADERPHLDVDAGGSCVRGLGDVAAAAADHESGAGQADDLQEGATVECGPREFRKFVAQHDQPSIFSAARWIAARMRW
jgi:hypothetical protein